MLSIVKKSLTQGRKEERKRWRELSSFVYLYKPACSRERVSGVSLFQLPTKGDGKETYSLFSTWIEEMGEK
jgi:hypothetical protein